MNRFLYILFVSVAMIFLVTACSSSQKKLLPEDLLSKTERKEQAVPYVVKLNDQLYKRSAKQPDRPDAADQYEHINTLKDLSCTGYINTEWNSKSPSKVTDNGSLFGPSVTSSFLYVSEEKVTHVFMSELLASFYEKDRTGRYAVRPRGQLDNGYHCREDGIFYHLMVYEVYFKPPTPRSSATGD